jgi:hydrogenase expression/formation protein HypC
MRLLEMNPPEAIVEISGVRRKINLALLSPDDLEIGDYVIVHAGFAIQKLDRTDAEERLKIFREMAELE